MKIYELLNFNKEFLRKLFFAGIRPADYRYADLFADYKQMLRGGEKVTYIVAALSQKYRVSERKVYAIIRKMNDDVEY